MRSAKPDTRRAWPVTATRRRSDEGRDHLNPFEFLEGLSKAIEQQPLMAALAALVGGILSTSA